MPSSSTINSTNSTFSSSSYSSSFSEYSDGAHIVINPEEDSHHHNHYHHHHHHHYTSRLYKRLPKVYDYSRTPIGNITGDGGRKAALASIVSAAASMMMMPNISSDQFHSTNHLYYHQPSSASASSSLSSNHFTTNDSVHSSKFLLSKISSLLMINQSSSSWNQTGSNYTGINPIFSSSHEIFSEPIRSQEPEEEIPMSFWIKIFFYVIYMLICWLGIFGNMIVCYVVARKPSMHTVTNVFIANLALSDILLCLFAVPFTPLYLITFKSWIFGKALCHLVPFAQGVSVYISAFTLMSIAIDRYFVILHPFKPRMQMRTCLLIIATIWISAMILTFPYAHFMKFTSFHYDYDDEGDDGNGGGGDLELFDPEVVAMDDDNNNNNNNNPIGHNNNSTDLINLCSEEWPHDEISKMFGITTTILQFVIPFLMITFCYVKICSKLSDRARTIPGNVSARREEQERERTRKTNGMLISMVIIFVISWLPMNMLNLLADFYTEATQWPHHETLFLISHAIAMSSTCYNPFLYAWLNDNFRKEFKEVLPCFGWLNRYFSRIVCRNDPNTTSSQAGSINQNRSSNINNNNHNNNNHHRQNHNDNNNNNNDISINNDDHHPIQHDDATKFWGCEDGNDDNNNNNRTGKDRETGNVISNSSFKRKLINFGRSSTSSSLKKKDADRKTKILMSSFNNHHHHHHQHQNDNGHKQHTTTTTTDVEEARQSLIIKDQLPPRYDGTYNDLGHNDNNCRESISIEQNSNTNSSSNSSNATVTTYSFTIGLNIGVIINNNNNNNFDN